MNQKSLTGQEVCAQIKRGLRGEVPISLQDPSHSWDGGYAGEVGFRFGDWVITFFNDCDELDYCDSARSPDGRVGKYEDWCGEFDADGDEVRQETEPTRCFLSGEENRQLEMLLKAAR